MHLDLQLIHLLFTEASQKWPPWKGGCRKAILKEGKQEEKAELC